MNSTTIVRAAPIVAAAWLAVASTTFAHTTVRDQATEGVTADNALRIGHTCTVAGGYAMPVVAQSVVFPTVAPILTASNGAPLTNLSQVIVQGSLAGLVSVIQDRSIFQAQQVKLDSNGNRIGYSGTRGTMDPALVGRSPFQFAAPRFVAASCASRLLIRIAIADICVAQRGTSLEAGTANLWIPDNGSAYAARARAYLNAEGVGAPATLIVNRNLATNPLPAECGAGYDVTVTPSPQDVNANLPIPGVWD